MKKDLVGKLQNFIFAVLFEGILRGGAVVARRAHNPKVVGSNPAPATKITSLTRSAGLFYLPDYQACLNSQANKKPGKAKLSGL